ncbi:Zinc finger BED domain containing protein 4 [Dissostichus eleginoides]|uniref:Zinc finger BED domain containing protein 4 n=1 Tax=Dissostichus eleginoides TaxID=100907 RepID=A0AAD9CNT6_DISEL|nr:Zinc finger BED domain containing protein 4 [Dissostichus eleginoides]
MERGREQDHAAFNAWKYRHYFEFDSHLASRHRNVKLIEKPPDPPTDMTAAATTSNSTGQTSDGPSPAKQVKIDLRATGLSAAELKKLVAGYIVEDMLPISTVDSESFRRIVEKIPTKSGVKLPQRKSFAGYLEREYDIMDANLKATLGEVDFVSTTADIWTVNNKSFMGVTIHWINSTLQRNKAALASSRSTLASEQVEEVSRRKLMVPTSTRWNSLYEAISRIITIPLNELNPLCVKLGIKCLNEREYQFLKEYCTVMKPLTVALDILQGDECTYGALLPTLTSLMSKTLALKDDLSRMTASLPDVIVKAIKTRFDAVLDSQEGLLAAATCPKFKLRWLRDERRREHVKELLTTECRKAAPATDNANVSQLPASPAEMDFFDFENQPTESFSAEKEVTDYLRSGYELEILNQFPNLKKMYMKYNTPTPSSAPVERLFSLGGLVLSPKRNRLSDRRFEKLLLMRYNHCFTPKENKKT